MYRRKPLSLKIQIQIQIQNIGIRGIDLESLKLHGITGIFIEFSGIKE